MGGALRLRIYTAGLDALGHAHDLAHVREVELLRHEQFEVHRRQQLQLEVPQLILRNVHCQLELSVVEKPLASVVKQTDLFVIFDSKDDAGAK